MTEKKKTRQHYSAEFKAEAVAKCKKIGTKKTADELGVGLVTLKNWVSKSERSPLDKSKPSYSELEREVRRLRKEIGYIAEINKVLKKSTAIFSASELGDSK